MTKIISIGIAGLARSGKTSAYQMIVEYFKDTKVRVVGESFAGPIKRGLAEMGVFKEDNHDLYRYLGQLAGDGCRELGHPNWWIDLVKSQITRLSDSEDDEIILFVVDDVRYPNELEIFNEEDGISVYIDAGVRLDTEQKMYEHASEQMAMSMEEYLREWVDFPPPNHYDIVIPNNESFENFEECIRGMLCSEISERIGFALVDSDGDLTGDTSHCDSSGANGAD